MIKDIEVATTEVFDLRAYANQLDLLIWNELSKNHTILPEELIELTLDISNGLQDVRCEVKKSSDSYEYLPIEVNKVSESLNEKFKLCVNGLQDGKLKAGYMKASELLNYCYKESSKVEYDYTVALRALIGTQEIIDDIYLILNTGLYTSGTLNLQYSAATTLLEGYPVNYDFLKYELGGDYPDGGTPAKNYFGFPLYEEPKGIIYPRDFGENDSFVVSVSTLGEMIENYPIANEGKKVSNVSKIEQRKKLEQKYNGENIPVDESGMIGLLADDIFAPNNLGIQIFDGYPNITIDAIGMIGLSRLHVRFKGDNLEAFNIYLKTSSTSIPMLAFEWFEDTYEGEQYWNAIFFETSDPRELEEAYLILEPSK